METHDAAVERVWGQIKNTHPEFTKDYDATDDPWTIENLLLLDGPYFKSFKGANVLDIGSNFGILSSYWALNGANVTSYEADPITYTMMCEMLKRTGLKVNAKNAAVWIHTGTIPFEGGSHVDRNRYCRNGFIQQNQPCETTVPCITLTEALGSTVWDFVKIDIEGAEFKVLINTDTEIMRNHIRAMNVELHECHDSVLHTELLEKLALVFDFVGKNFVNRSL
jgi:FkbM family methyltransferase